MSEKKPKKSEAKNDEESVPPTERPEEPKQKPKAPSTDAVAKAERQRANAKPPPRFVLLNSVRVGASLLHPGKVVEERDVQRVKSAGGAMVPESNVEPERIAAAVKAWKRGDRAAAERIMLTGA